MQSIGFDKRGLDTLYDVQSRDLCEFSPGRPSLSGFVSSPVEFSLT